MSTEVTNSHLINVVATPLWGVCISKPRVLDGVQRRGYSARGLMRWLLVTTNPLSFETTARRASGEMRTQTVSSPCLKARPRLRLRYGLRPSAALRRLRLALGQSFFLL